MNLDDIDSLQEPELRLMLFLMTQQKGVDGFRKGATEKAIKEMDADNMRKLLKLGLSFVYTLDGGLSEKDAEMLPVEIAAALRAVDAKFSTYNAPQEPKSEKRSKQDKDDPDVEQAIRDMIDAKEGFDFTPEAIERLRQFYSGENSGYGEVLKKARAKLDAAMNSKNQFQIHVHAAIQADADLLAERVNDGLASHPSQEEIKLEVIAKIGQSAYGIEESSRWSPVMKEAGLASRKLR